MSDQYEDSTAQAQIEGRSLVIDNAPMAMTAQRVGVKRDLARIMADIKVSAAAAGERYYFRWPVKSGDGKTTYVEGPTIKCAQNVARIYGNATVGARVIDEGMFYSIEAFFVDLETGFNLMRPYRQRKSQRTMKTDADRQADIVVQIGISKAIRNVITNALESLCDYAMEEAKNSLVDKIGKNLPGARQRLLDRLQDINVAPDRVARIVGRSVEQMLAPDIARLVAEIQAVEEGMASVDDLWPTAEQTKTAAKADAKGLDQFNQAEPPQPTQQETPTAPRRGRPPKVQPAPQAPAPLPPLTPVQEVPIEDLAYAVAFTLVTVQGEPLTWPSLAEFAPAFLQLLEEAQTPEEAKRFADANADALIAHAARNRGEAEALWKSYCAQFNSTERPPWSTKLSLNFPA